MNKYQNFNFYFQLFHSKSDSFALVSLSKETLILHSKALSIINNDYPDVLVSHPDNQEMYRYFLDVLEEGVVIKIDHVENISDIKTWLSIKSGAFVPENEWQYFLHENYLLDKWISGELSGMIGTYYKERSKSFGERESFREQIIKFESRNEIWSFEKYFNGILNEKYGEHVNYHYQHEIKLTRIQKTLLNKEWLHKMKDVRNSFEKMVF